jgi:membrane protein YdbS with pleckstrin-like domain
MAQIILFGIILCVLLFYYGSPLGDHLSIAMLAVAALSIVMILLAFIRSRFETVSLDDKTISHTAGILSTKKVIVPYTKVTEAKYSQGILHRVFGVGSLRVDSAGGTEVAINVEEIRTSDLESIITAINEKTHPNKGE